MNISEMMLDIPVNHPDCRIETPREQSRGFSSFSIILPNQWSIKCAYGSAHYCSNHGKMDGDILLCEDVELSIFKPTGMWYMINEGESPLFKGAGLGVLGWRKITHIYQIINFLKEKR